MKLNYRIIAVDPADSAITVRYSTDALTEQALSSEPGDAKGSPDRCRTDYNLTLWKHDISVEELHDLIVRSAPRDWLKLKERTLKEPPALAAATALIGRTHTVSLTEDGEIDLTPELGRTLAEELP